MKYHARNILLAAAAFLTSSAFANDVYTIDPARSNIAFKVGHFVGSTSGKFTRYSGRIEVDREHPEHSSVVVRIETASIDTGINKRDRHLESDEFFDAARFPEITFRSKSVRRTGPRSGDITGDLTMHGVTRETVLHASLVSPNESDEHTRWSVTTAPIQRSDFKLMFSKTAEALSGIGQNVSVVIAIDAVRAR
jgi:polyisoprenoid-binding protein YceI